MAANTITVKTNEGSLKTLFSKIQHIGYYAAGEITKTLLSSGFDVVNLPVIEDSVSLNTGEPDTTEVNILDGTVWTSKATKGDSDISFQVASISEEVNSIFMTADSSSVGITGIKYGNSTYTGKGYTLDVKKATGGLVLSDDTGDTIIVLPSVEMYGSLVVADGDNPAYFNVKVTPSLSSDNLSLIILKKTA